MSFRSFVSVAIPALLVLACSSVPPAPPAPNPLFNFSGGDKDGNQFALNPAWSGQIGDACANPYVCNKDLNGGRCNTQKLPGSGTDTAQRVFWRALLAGKLFHYTCEGAAKTGHFPGHVNVGYATYDGIMAWDGISMDADYDLRLYPRQGGVTSSNPQFIHVEFDSDETLNQFDQMTDWWRNFREASLKVPNDGSVDAVLGGQPYAVMTGLVGFDCEHDCHSELHPIYALAIRQPSTDGIEHWSILARNWGNEGWCSSLIHIIGSPVRVLLPYGDISRADVDPGATSFRVYRARGLRLFDKIALIFSPDRGKKATYSPVVKPGQGIEVTFDLPDWRRRAVVVGELAFRTNPEAKPPSVAPRSCGRTELEATAPDTYMGDEERAARLMAKLPKGAVKLVLPQPAGGSEPLPTPSALAMAPSFEVAATAPPAPFSATANAALKPEAIRDQRLRQICEAAASRGLAASDDYREICGRR